MLVSLPLKRENIILVLPVVAIICAILFLIILFLFLNLRKQEPVPSLSPTPQTREEALKKLHSQSGTVNSSPEEKEQILKGFSSSGDREENSSTLKDRQKLLESLGSP